MCLSYPALPTHEVSLAIRCRALTASKERILPDIVKGWDDVLVYVLERFFRYQVEVAPGNICLEWWLWMS
jgi:hypothetical protein